VFTAHNIQYETADRARSLICGGSGAMRLPVKTAGMPEIADNLENGVWKRLWGKPKYTLKTEPRRRRKPALPHRGVLFACFGSNARRRGNSEGRSVVMDAGNTADADNRRSRKGKAVAVSMVAGLLIGAVVTGVAGWTTMPRMMIVTEQSRLGFDETISALGKAITDQGWISPGTTDMQASLAKHGQEFPHRVKIIKLCQPQYASDILTTDRHVACLMPCSIAVWEDDDGKVYISKMNTGLMGKMFGGNIAEVMGDKVARDEAVILGHVVDN
jgi:uncharacterized protein (DUF302 family)